MQRSILKQYYYLYKITNLINNKIYIGIRSTNNLNDGYFGSGVTLRKAIKKYGRENFNKEILEWFDWRCEAINREEQIVNLDFVKRSDTYNMTIGGQGGPTNLGRLWNAETKIKNKNSHIGKLASEETKLKMSENHKNNNSLFIVRHSDKTKLALSKHQKELWADPLYKDSMLKIYNKHDYKIKASLRTTKVWNNSELRDKMIKGMKDSYTKERREDTSKRSKLLWDDPEYRKRIIGNGKKCSIFGEIFNSYLLGYNKFKELMPDDTISSRTFKHRLRTGEIKDCFVIDINNLKLD